MILERNKTRLERNDTCLARNETRSGNLHLSGTVVLGIFKFEKCVKYANDKTDDIIYSTQFYIMYINRAILPICGAEH